MLHVQDCLYSEDLPPECITECSSAGDQTSTVAYWREALGLTVEPQAARRYLSETGMESERVDEMEEDDLADYVLWLACCDFKEQGGGVLSLWGWP